MKRIRMPMFRYGDSDWYKDYLKWGFHDESTQIGEAESVLRLVGKRTTLRILDLACGIGTHAVYWAEHGHTVTAVDISQISVEEGKKRVQGWRTG